MQQTPDIIINHEGRTNAQMMYYLMQQIDYSKLRINSKLLIGTSIFTLETLPPSASAVLTFTQTEIFGTILRTIQYTAGTNNNTCRIIDNNGYRDASNDQSTTDISVYY